MGDLVSGHALRAELKIYLKAMSDLPPYAISYKSWTVRFFFNVF